MSNGNIAMVTKATERLLPANYALVALLVAVLALPAPARADDFPNDVKRTFTTDIPHFFQDDIPCAFGGKPTSGAKASCKSSGKPAATQHKATTHKKKRTAAKQPASKATTSAPQSSEASAGASAGGAAGTPPAASPAR